VDATTAAAPDIVALVERYAAHADRELDRRVGVLSAPLDARESVTRRQQTAVGHFLAALMRERLGADVGLLNSGAIRGNRVIPAGPVTLRDFRTLLPFSNVVVLVEIQGSTLTQALERSVAALPRPAGAFLQTAGIRFAADPTRHPGARVSGVEIGGAPLRPEARYRVALPDYLARGGDGYTMLTTGRVLVSPEEGPGLIDTVLDALARGRLP
jgi:2',3'-cyclic-nucleotide 2'-phosphodiesterase (5'-nucleotidase family)